jgi:hypothetical protein
MRRRVPLLSSAAVLGLMLASSARAVEPPSPLSLLAPTSLDALSGSLRGILVRSLPDPLFEASPGWGQMKYVARGVEWHGLLPEVQRSHKNDGTWRKVRFTADRPADTLVLDLRNPQFPEPGRMTFDLFLCCDTHVDYTHQEWKNGRKLYDGSVRARLRVKLNLSCEATTRLESNGSLLPDAVFRLRVTKADLHYDNLVVEHVGGVGGELAKVVGDAFHGGLKQWYPSLEREMLARVDAAIVKAGDTKEVRVNLVSLFNKKGKPSPGPSFDLRKLGRDRSGSAGRD